MSGRTVQVDYEVLRKLAVLRHERQAYSGSFIPNGGSCRICKCEWAEGKPEKHSRKCPLRPPVSS